ncbi:NADH-quinone oxidoreductase subunit N [Dactylosporangium aurantiacum]|uniref:NADH-quinone oxidoreductase subunit N n=1 Tax=Dactylosporangium aurantiacum TaxID=35754 RepID=A0A9Q9ILY6_9ACTN|nr:NADH-quinone oxidoreductase subunit N [Dactylosporangium aurantiacum]MDG6110303.1 NADH-quinone oxidoreductase subunit N [Dactylosporangium aurantiacum]UWZ58577.1 NADH-quinone oxidoreductase subunit N [Dactylosporangium aurantiacum]
MNEKPLVLLPEVLLLVGAVATLLCGSSLSRTRQGIAALIAAVALAGSMIAAVAGRADQTVYHHSYAIDTATTTARVVIPAAALLIIALSTGRIRGDRRQTEFYVLVLLAALGAVLLAGASDLLVLAVAYLLATIPLYGLAGWGRDAPGAEAALKLYLLGALVGVVLLTGVALLYAAGGTTRYDQLTGTLPNAAPGLVAAGTVAVLAGLLFKAGAVPVHFWVPDAVHGSTIGAATVLTTIPKIGALIAAFRLLVAIPTDTGWPTFTAVVAAVTMTLGNLAAFGQTSVRRLLAYSTISQVGYLLMAVAVATTSGRALPALLLYLAGYAVTNTGAFAVVAALPDRGALDDYRAVARRHPWLAAALVICLLGLVGTPPTAVFAGKLTVFTATWDGGHAWLVVIAAANTIASLFYYLRWLRPTFTGRPGAFPSERERDRPAATIAVLAAAATLAFGVAAGVVYDVVSGVLLR